jgi:hypothetical protein
LGNRANNWRQNIEKAKKEIERLEAEESEGAATPNGVNGKKGGEDKAVAEVVDGVKAATIEDKKDEAAAEA